MPEYEDRLDTLFLEAFDTNHPAMGDWALVKMELKRLRNTEHVKILQDVINDLTLSLEMWLGDYPFDADHKYKQKRMIDNACVLIGKPRTIKELKEMMGLE